MPQETPSKDDIIKYIFPDLETLNEFFKSLNLKNTQLALSLLKDVLNAELDAHAQESK